MDTFHLNGIVMRHNGKCPLCGNLLIDGAWDFTVKA